MVSVQFYDNFHKKLNSTKRPTGSGTLSQCRLKDECSVLAPTIELTARGLGNPVDYNYAYIPDFNRYYYCKWTYTNAIWNAELTVDTLATAKDEIENATLYVERSSHSFNGNIIDTYYPVKVAPVLIKESTAGNPWQTKFENGTYILGVIGKNHGQQAGAVNYIAMTQGQFANLMSTMYEPSHFLSNIADWSDMEVDAFRAQFNPMQYIVSCMWFPFTAQWSHAEPLYLGWYPLSGISYGSNVHDYHFTLSFEIPRHPQAQGEGLYPDTPYAGQTRGVYLDVAPYSTYMLDFKPFGQIQLDGTKFLGKLNLKCKVDVDCITGEAILTLMVERGIEDPYYPGDAVIETRRGRVGVEMSIAQVAKNYVAQSVALVRGAATFAKDMSNITSKKDIINKGVTSATVGTVANAVANLAGNIGSVIDNQYPSADIAGHNGTSIDFEFTPRLVGTFRYITLENNNHIGRPLCKEVRLGDIPGFIKCAEGDIELGLTAEETATVMSYLTGGFFLE